MRRFNTTGLCVPQRHYMVDISGRVEQIRAMVDEGAYFCINRGRQYGKTTTIAALERALSGDYAVASLDFQALSHEDFATDGDFAVAFAREVCDREGLGAIALPDSASSAFRALKETDTSKARLADLFACLGVWLRASERPVVLIVDEVDSATNNQVFLDFLARLRLQYLEHEKRPGIPAFQSVILAGVTDVKHLKAKIRPEDQRKVNSPWNIAADFDVRMSFDEADVAGMLREYEADHATGMDADSLARGIVGWTGGYPFLVSRVCQLVDKHGLPWDERGLDAAVRILLSERNTLFESLAGKLESYPELKGILRSLLMEGERLPYNTMQDGLAQLEMYGFVRKDPRNGVVVSNRIFELQLYDLFILEDKIAGSRSYDAGEIDAPLYVRGGRLDMCAVLEGFRRAYVQIFGPPEEGERFCEDEGRKQFLLFLKPIINGTGNYYVEAQTRDRTRMDVVVDYAGEQFVVELKIWRGQRYNEEGERQVLGYLEHFGLDVGYMVSFNFNRRKEPGLRRVELGERVLFEETV